MYLMNYWMYPVAKVIHIPDISCIVARMCTAARKYRKQNNLIVVIIRTMTTATGKSTQGVH